MRWRRVVKITPPAALPPGKGLNGKIGGLQGRSGRSGEERSLSTLPRFKHRFIQRVPGRHAKYRTAPTPHSFEPGLSGKAIDQSTVPIYRLPSSRESPHKKSNVTQSEKFNFRAHRHWRNLANNMGMGVGGEGRGPRRLRVLRCHHSVSCKTTVFIFLSLQPYRQYFYCFY